MNDVALKNLIIFSDGLKTDNENVIVLMTEELSLLGDVIKLMNFSNSDNILMKDRVI